MIRYLFLGFIAANGIIIVYGWRLDTLKQRRKMADARLVAAEQRVEWEAMLILKAEAWRAHAEGAISIEDLIDINTWRP